MKAIVSMFFLLITLSCHTIRREMNYVLRYRLDSNNSVNSHELLDEVYCYKECKCIYRIRYAHNGWQKIDSTCFLYDNNGILNSIQIFDVVSNKWGKNTKYSSKSRLILKDDKYGAFKLDKYELLYMSFFNELKQLIFRENYNINVRRDSMNRQRITMIMKNNTNSNMLDSLTLTKDNQTTYSINLHYRNKTTLWSFNYSRDMLKSIIRIDSTSEGLQKTLYKYVCYTESEYCHLRTNYKSTTNKNIFYCYSPNIPEYPLKCLYCVNDTISSVVTMANPLLLLDSSSISIDKDSLSYFSYYDNEHNLIRHSRLNEYGIPLKDSFLLSSIYIFEIGEILEHLNIEKIRKTKSSIEMIVKSKNKSSYKTSLLDSKHIYQVDIHYNKNHITNICYKQDNRWVKKQLIFKDSVLKEERCIVHDLTGKYLLSDTLKYSRLL